jgi:hypothetical protein
MLSACGPHARDSVKVVESMRSVFWSIVDSNCWKKSTFDMSWTWAEKVYPPGNT